MRFYVEGDVFESHDGTFRVRDKYGADFLLVDGKTRSTIIAMDALGNCLVEPDACYGLARVVLEEAPSVRKPRGDGAPRKLAAYQFFLREMIASMKEQRQRVDFSAIGAAWRALDASHREKYVLQAQGQGQLAPQQPPPAAEVGAAGKKRHR